MVQKTASTPNLCPMVRMKSFFISSSLQEKYACQLKHIINTRNSTDAAKHPVLQILYV